MSQTLKLPSNFPLSSTSHRTAGQSLGSWINLSIKSHREFVGGEGIGTHSKLGALFHELVSHLHPSWNSLRILIDSLRIISRIQTEFPMLLETEIPAEIPPGFYRAGDLCRWSWWNGEVRATSAPTAPNTRWNRSTSSLSLHDPSISLHAINSICSLHCAAQ